MSLVHLHGFLNKVVDTTIACVMRQKNHQSFGSVNMSIQTHWAYQRYQERKQLWQARYDSYYAALNLRPGSVGYITDVCVPISQLALCINRTRALLDTSELMATILGHVGDGNFHVVFPLEPNNREELAEAQNISNQIVDIALELDGTCTGEHGIGIGKRCALEKEHGAAVGLMRKIKNALDPQNLMNPGKVFM